jgi:hypothetical protein
MSPAHTIVLKQGENEQHPGDFRARSNGPSSKASDDDGPGDPAPVGSLAAMR